MSGSALGLCCPLSGRARVAFFEVRSTHPSPTSAIPTANAIYLQDLSIGHLIHSRHRDSWNKDYDLVGQPAALHANSFKDFDGMSHNGLGPRYGCGQDRVHVVSEGQGGTGNSSGACGLQKGEVEFCEHCKLGAGKKVSDRGSSGSGHMIPTPSTP